MDVRPDYEEVMISPIQASRRSGVTLIEVLVAIFVASIGLLALLALFPVGALSMKQALKDSRCAQCAVNAMALFQSQSIGLNSELNYLNSLSDPFSDGLNGTTLGTRPPASANGPSYPLYIDPLGAYFRSNSPPTNDHLPLPIAMDKAGIAYPRILRAGLSLVRPHPLDPPDPPNTIPPINPAKLSLFVNWFTLQDDIVFDPDNPGLPCPPTTNLASPTPFNRDSRYSFAYMVRRPYAGIPTTFDVTVVVYSGRSLTASLGAIEEQPFSQALFIRGSTSVRVPFTAPLPSIKPGGWILDASMYDDTGALNPQGYFYRVVDVLDNGDSTMTIELQTPARISTTYSDPLKQGMVLYLDNVAEVFERGTVSLQ
jgi:prepilin-type N-terminal cleavage/methylation domain-containing protein